ncbi:molybdopterin-dependent oxidoreductase [Labedaea rhizosphaerae]|uniref:Molybdopterin-dependent oxidoreductase-like protein n=1 Tax=Labedaea rhizosphaerae TaxID=598644 RepID=A0A4R6SKA6_LABRH|nr:molybdopterin-dependent oxidoreductase [Labedaea rhizosphaerae]TDQ04347.1 molybdopterin-dependent oxidoreductase-like protein [Labedaea rhizosphaerae]
MKVKVPAEEDFKSAAHDERVTARLGLWLGICFGLCFVTGLLSHAIQHPPTWFYWPSRPVNLYRVTQGTHVISGVAAIPLLLAKLWSVYPKLFARPLAKSLVNLVERGSILLLSAAAFFELITGILNVAQNYAFPFFFPPVHYAVAWIAVGSILIHVAVKLPIVRRALKASTKGDERPGVLSRRGFLRSTGVVTGVAVVATAGATVPFLRRVSPLSWRTADLPVNRSALAAGMTRLDPGWRLKVITPGGTRQFSLDELNKLPQTTAELPIACVEGWSASATWTGVSIPDLLHAVGAAPGAEVRVESMERNSIYRVSVLPSPHTSDAKTLLALRLNGEVLNADHGYPCRIIAPSRPGVLQTKWVGTLEVLS